MIARELALRAAQLLEREAACGARCSGSRELVMTDLRKAAQESLSAVQDVLEAAYHRCYQECCERPGNECCGNPLQAWSPDDQHIMETLGPVEKTLRAALAADAATSDDPGTV